MNKTILGLVVLVIGALVGWYVFQGRIGGVNLPLPQGGVTPTSVVNLPDGFGGDVTQITPPGDSKGGVGEIQVQGFSAVSYTDNGFNPKSITVKKGTQAGFTNQSKKEMWVASAVHPTHQLLPGFDQLKSVGVGGSYLYTFIKVGTWKYHNHKVPEDVGTVIVTE